MANHRIDAGLPRIRLTVVAKLSVNNTRVINVQSRQLANVKIHTILNVTNIL